tara:strand:+ start:5377 stop:5625 length:249 start_codon:yes stop_codon:yes gene_type:complete
MILGFLVVPMLFIILCTTSFVAGTLAKSIKARPDANSIMDPSSLRTVLLISRITFYVSSGASAIFLLVGFGVAVFWALGLFP